jgi:uncharacterized protein (TIGR00661 family)
VFFHNLIFGFHKIKRIAKLIIFQKQTVLPLTGKNIDNSLTVLVAPLNWGLGHATRCIPLIKELQAQNCRVIIAGEGQVTALLQQEFPNLDFLLLRGVTIKYTSGPRGFFFKMILQLPAVLWAVYQEHKRVNQFIKQYKPDVVISDNRPGIYNKNCYTIYLTHQLQIKTGAGKWMDRAARSLHYFFINRFNECWVPDFENSHQNLAGELAHPTQLPHVPVTYLGPLSRFEQLQDTGKEYDYLILLSGPEPQRTILENKLLNQLSKVDGKILMVRGLPGKKQQLASTNQLTIVNHMPSALLNRAIHSASIIIARSGYTTVMDLFKLQKKAILIPTPGQPEQEYLAKQLKKETLFYTCLQEDFDLKEALMQADLFYTEARTFEESMNDYKQIVRLLVTNFKNKQHT